MNSAIIVVEELLLSVDVVHDPIVHSSAAGANPWMNHVFDHQV
jgi:hypothetical protein